MLFFYGSDIAWGQIMRRLSMHSIIGIATGAYFFYLLPAAAQGLDQKFSPIKEAQESDPAGFTLMIVCIGILVTMVLGLFGGTIFYMSRDKKNKQERASRQTKPEVETASGQE